MSLPTSRPVLVLAAVLACCAGAAAEEGDPCWECRAAACYSTFKDTTDRAWRETEAESMARWETISAAAASLEAANAEHDAVAADLEAQRDADIAAAYGKMLACLEP